MAERRPEPVARRLLRTVLRAGLPLLVLAGAALAVTWMMQSAPKAERTVRERQARLVEVLPAETRSHQVVVAAFGTARPAVEVTVRPQITGEVVEVADDLVPGGRLAAGDLLLRLDPRSYEFAVQQRESDLERAKADLAVEQGSQKIAQQEYDLLGQQLSAQEKALVLRRPQLQTARAAVAAAEAALGEALLDLERTRMTAPFDALVIEEFVDKGSRLTTQTDIARLAGTDTYWIEVAVPMNDLRWIPLPGESGDGANVRLTQPQVWGPGAFREGRVIRVLGDVSSEGRMARLLVAVDDPLALEPAHEGKPALILGAYLKAEIAGRSVAGSLALDRRLLRDGDRVWLMTDDDRLEIRDVEIAYRGPGRVIVTGGIADGERIVATDIAAAAPGMALRTVEAARPAAGGQ